MKTVLCVLAVLAYVQAENPGKGVGSGGVTTHIRDVGSIEDSVRRYITDKQYPAEIYEIETQDGYQLQVVRIPHGVHRHREGMLDGYDRYDQSTLPTGSGSGIGSGLGRGDRRAIILMPGMMSTYEDFVIGGPTEGLAFRLADEGYDVYMGNARGSFYGQKHRTLDPERDVPFWRYSFEEIGTKDLPAIIDKVLEVSGQQKAYYIGHMQGTTCFYAMASGRPEYVEKIEKMVSLGPVAYMENANNYFLRRLDKKIKEQEDYFINQLNKGRGDVWISAWMAGEVGVNVYGLSTELLNTIKTDKCFGSGYDAQICKNTYFIVNGFNSRKYNKTTVEKFLQRSPSPASSRQILHHVQTMISGRFNKYEKNYDRTNQERTQSYDLSKVNIPVVVIYTPEDTWSQEQDVQRLINELPNVVYNEKIDTVTNNFDLLFADNVNTRVYDRIVRHLGHNNAWNPHVRTGRRTSLTS